MAAETWTESHKRIPGAVLDAIQFFDFETGWINGHILQTTPKDAFFLLTTDGGKTWRRRDVTGESRTGAVDQFWFDSRQHGLATIDRVRAAEGFRYELWESQTGGESWSVRQVDAQPIAFTKPPRESILRIRTDAKAQVHRLERRDGAKWVPVAAFQIAAGECRPPAPEFKDAPPEITDTQPSPAPDAAGENGHAARPSQTAFAPEEPLTSSTSSSIELEVFRHLLASAAEEMGIVLRKTAYSANIKERRDYSCAVYDADGQTVAMGEHMPVHLGAMPMSVQHAIAEVSPGPGDVVIVNDPFRGGTHLPDITAVAGVFLKNQRKPAFYVANRAHHADVGGMSPGSMPMATEIYQEGIRIPPTLLQHRGKVREDILQLLLANVRTPAEREGDLLAQLMSISRGEARLLALVERHGAPAVRRNMTRLVRYSELMMRAAIERIPDGTYTFSDVLDNDGFTPSPVEIQVSVTIASSDAIVDFTGSSPQRAGPVNANLAIVNAAVGYVFRCLLDEESFHVRPVRPLRIIAPERTVVNAVAPAPMAAGNVEHRRELPTCCWEHSGKPCRTAFPRQVQVP